MRWLRIDDGDDADRHVVVGTREHGRTGVGEAERHVAGADLLDRFGRYLAAQDVHVELRILVKTFLDCDKIVSVPPEEAGIGDDANLILRRTATPPATIANAANTAVTLLRNKFVIVVPPLQDFSSTQIRDISKVEAANISSTGTIR